MNIEDVPGEESISPDSDLKKEKKTHEDIMSEFDTLGISKTEDLKEVLAEKDFKKAKEWLEFIKHNREDFSQYDDSWFSDREREIREAEENPDREWKPTQTVEAANKFLNEKFGFSATDGFRKALKDDIETAEEWLNHIIDNSNDFSKYHGTWGSWVRDRKSELEKAKSE